MNKTYILRYVAMLCMSTLCCACAHIGGPQEVHFSAAQLQQTIARKLTGSHELLPLVAVKVSDVQVALLPERNRIVARFNAELDEPTGQYPLKGRMGLSGALRFDAATQSIRLAEPALDEMTWQNVAGLTEKLNDARTQKLVQRLANLLSKELANNVTLYQIKPDDLKRMGTEFIPTDFVVKPDGVAVTLQPK